MAQPPAQQGFSGQNQGPIKTFLIRDVDDYEDVNKFVLDSLSFSSLFVLTGDLGAGKTTFVSQWLKSCFGIDDVTSPTFSIVNLHEGFWKQRRLSIVHCDLYRLESPSDMINLGLEDVLDNADIALIEWPEILNEQLGSRVAIHFEHSEGGRQVTISHVE